MEAYTQGKLPLLEFSTDCKASIGAGILGVLGGKVYYRTVWNGVVAKIPMRMPPQFPSLALNCTPDSKT